MPTDIPPPVSPRPWSLSGDPAALLRDQGFALAGAEALAALTGVGADVLADWRPYWNRLAPDRHLRDGGRYRARRHGCFIQTLARAGSATETGAGTDTGDGAGTLAPVPHRAHWQSTDYNALHGGIDRWFEPIEPGLAGDPRWARLLLGLGRLFAGLAPSAPGAAAAPERWYIEAHPFRIDAADGVGRPTPEGAHRDGVDFVAVILVERHGVKGGETRVFEADGPRGMRFVIDRPWSALLIDDARVIHETTPIQPDGEQPHRDTLVLTWRRGGFQSA